MDTVAMIGRLLVSLAAVLGVMWVIARRARKGIKGGKSNRVIEVLDRANLTRNASVAVVRVNDRAFVLGVAESQVNILGETDLAAAEESRQHATSGSKRTRRAPAAASHRPTKIVVPAPQVTEAAPAAPAAPATHRPQQNGALAGSALSPQTWKQTIESLRDLTARP